MAEQEFQEFPKWKYSGDASQIVKDKAAEEELGPEWGDKPGFTPAPAAGGNTTNPAPPGGGTDDKN